MNVSLPILWPICEPCILEEKKEMITYYQKNREKILDKYYEKKEKKITYYEKNKEKILEKYYEKRNERLEYQFHYNQNHKEEQKNRNKQYYLEHREKMIEKAYRYQMENKEKLKSKVVCECGAKILLSGKNAHLKTEKHISLLSKKK